MYGEGIEVVFYLFLMLYFSIKKWGAVGLDNNQTYLSK